MYAYVNESPPLSVCVCEIKSDHVSVCMFQFEYVSENDCVRVLMHGSL